MSETIHWPPGLDRHTLEREIGRGGRFVFFDWCVSLGVASRRGVTDVLYLRPEESGIWRGLPWAALTFALGWWALPMGPIWTTLALYNWLQGGRDATADVLARGGPP